ncbi:MAG TPA: hypothetical protein VMP67_04925 [Candidatus Limnocylindria bacterium]|nr:hypothetical protein [Candidatus Limnocylindria bacterium]
MSKRTRGAARPQHRRPGARPASGRGPRRPLEADVGEIEPRRSAEPDEAPESWTAASTPMADQPAEREAARVPRAHGRPRVKAGSLLAARAAIEYVYVKQDLKRITVLGVLLFATLIALWLLIVVLEVVPLPFY